jgi:2-keto-4-pentenoate hydratase
MCWEKAVKSSRNAKFARNSNQNTERITLDIAVSDLAARQLRDYLQGTPGIYFAEDHPPLELEEAYGVQAEVAKLRSVAGDSIAGYKVGCIGPKIREAFGMSGPISGILFTSELRPSGSAVSASKHTSLAIEGEMAVRIGAKDQIVCAFPVIELHNYVFRAKVRSLSELVANNGLNAGVIFPRLEDTTAHPVCPQSGKLEIRINDELTDSGPMWSMPGGPEEAVAWLKHHLPQYGLSLQAGQIILTGTSLGLHHVRPSDRIQVFAEGCGGLEARIID